MPNYNIIENITQKIAEQLLLFKQEYSNTNMTWDQAQKLYGLRGIIESCNRNPMAIKETVYSFFTSKTSRSGRIKAYDKALKELAKMNYESGAYVNGHNEKLELIKRLIKTT